jgi:dihydrodipicolinate synthase/N-acetylneuraminate lyase
MFTRFTPQLHTFGIKYRTGDITQIDSLVKNTQEFTIFADSERFYLAALVTGVVGEASALGNIAIADSTRMEDTYRKGRLKIPRKFKCSRSSQVTQLSAA